MNKLEEVKEDAQAGGVFRRTAGSPDGRGPNTAKMRWRIVAAVPLAVIIAIRIVWLSGALATFALVGGRLRQLLGVNVDDGGADLLDDLRKPVGEAYRRGNNQRLGVGGVDACLLFAADVARENGAGEDANG